MKNYKIVITFFLLWLTIQFDYEAENILAYLSILTLGLLHGANDIKLLESKERSEKVNSYLILLAYVGFVSVVGLLFYLIPVLALMVFVVLSGFHFGEEHLHGKYRLQSSLFTYFFTAYGLLILFLIFYFNATSTSQIIYDITSYRLGSIFFLIGVLVSGLGTLLCSILLFKNKRNDVSYLEELVYILVFIIVFKLANLLWSFAIYFVIWHAIPSLYNQIQFLYGNTTKTAIIKYFKSSFIYWMFSILGVVFLYNYLRNDMYLFNAVFFAFLASITFPHVWVINSMKNKQ